VNDAREVKETVSVEEQMMILFPSERSEVIITAPFLHVSVLELHTPCPVSFQQVAAAYVTGVYLFQADLFPLTAVIRCEHV
jgi:hypothetical protein